MTSEVAAYVDAVRKHTDDGCFVCGRENPIGMHMDDFAIDDGVVSATFSPRTDYRGIQGTLHGGLSAAALDEIMVWAGILTEDVLTVTGTMEIRYGGTLGVSDMVVARAWVDERRGRRLRISGELRVGDSRPVSGSGLYIVSAEMSHILNLSE